MENAGNKIRGLPFKKPIVTMIKLARNPMSLADFISITLCMHSMLTMGSAETRSGVGKSSMLEHKSGNISETQRAGLATGTNARSVSIIPDPYGPLPQLEVRNLHPKLQSIIAGKRLHIHCKGIVCTEGL